ncbi:hypothetical protein BH18THE2_BH18THE2_20370 [soil metagenome]
MVESLNHTDIQNILVESTLTPSFFAISILVSIIDLQIAYYFWIAILPAKIILRKMYAKQT